MQKGSKKKKVSIFLKTDFLYRLFRCVNFRSFLYLETKRTNKPESIVLGLTTLCLSHSPTPYLELPVFLPILFRSYPLSTPTSPPSSRLPPSPSRTTAVSLLICIHPYGLLSFCGGERKRREVWTEYQISNDFWVFLTFIYLF